MHEYAIEMSKINKARYKGFHAGQNGVDKDKNPYCPDQEEDLWRAWYLGWCEGYHE